MEAREKFEGPYIVNLLSNEVLPSLASINLPVGEYKELTFKIHKLDEGDVDGIGQQDPLMKQSIYLTGVYTPSGGSPIQVSLKTDVDEEFSLMKEGSLAPGVQIAEDATNQVIIAFRLAEWFNFNGFTYDFSDLTAADNQLDNDAGEIEKQLRERIKENIKDSADFGKDGDGDGDLNKEEDTDDSNDDEDKTQE
ncbi:MAG TPA: hypothetical protein VFO10_05375 [Oligoflexus sp.]|uniref:hypothetical protein n=1 Tax=Oligoflexus sp. TaxID=1971216 RepID=UPI002D7FD1F5|nr:hypothetical protein [Oligoflexus sp.]HET9236656.1 hypothetical protein [Oligoflexus sp.]